ncbi:MAG: tetratricopeptide repeat protein [Firmicutes bacterium]|nr:tetratricopeptide repeat protein [Bacillota bacterium]
MRKSIVLPALFIMFIILFTAPAIALTEEEYISDAAVFRNSGHLQKAYDCYTQALRLNPKSVSALRGRGSTLKAMRKFNPAIQDLSKAIKIDPTYIPVYYERSSCYLRLKQYNKAIADARKMLAIKPNHAIAYYDLGSIYTFSGKYQLAIQNFDLAIKAYPKLGVFYLDRGIVYLLTGNFKQADYDFKKAVELDANHPYFQLFFGLAEQRTGGDGLTQFNKVLKENKITRWPRPLYELFAGKITPAQCLGKVESTDNYAMKEQKCEAFFYIGEYYLIKKDKTKAAEYFRKSISTGVDWYYEYYLAKTELKRLGVKI